LLRWSGERWPIRCRTGNAHAPSPGQRPGGLLASNTPVWRHLNGRSFRSETYVTEQRNMRQSDADRARSFVRCSGRRVLETVWRKFRPWTSGASGGSSRFAGDCGPSPDRGAAVIYPPQAVARGATASSPGSPTSRRCGITSFAGEGLGCRPGLSPDFECLGRSLGAVAAMHVSAEHRSGFIFDPCQRVAKHGQPNRFR
jgi:hypothetical protein